MTNQDGSKQSASNQTATKHILTYDKDCGFCTRAALWLARVSEDTQAVALQTFDYASHGLTYEEFSNAAYFFRNDGRIFGGTDAIGRALLEARPPWRYLGLPFVFPVTSSIARALYPTLARNRHHMPGGTPACDVKQNKDGQS